MTLIATSAALKTIREDSKIGDHRGMTTDEFKQNLRKRSIFIFSANLEGRGLARRLEKIVSSKITFIDSRYRSEDLGRTVISKLDEFFEIENTNTALLIVASKDRKLKSDVLEMAARFGFTRGGDVYTPLDLCPFFPTIEVAGKCNLKCKSCDMGLPKANSGRGFMDANSYRSVLEKLLDEIPFLNSVALYTWGEPLLNPHIAQIISISNEMGVSTEVSSNLESHKYLDEFVLAKPTQIVAPCAGVGWKYERGRTGGTWDNYLKGLVRISSLNRAHNLGISLRIMYHIYRDNYNADLDYMRLVADDLGFEVIPIAAQLFPGQVLKYALSGQALPQPFQEAEENLVFGLDEQLAFAQSRINSRCHIINAFPTISWDGRVLHCCNMQEPHVGSDRFLDSPLNEFIDKRDKSIFCTRCMNVGVHRFFDVNVKFEEAADGKRSITRL